MFLLADQRSLLASLRDRFHRAQDDAKVEIDKYKAMEELYEEAAHSLSELIRFERDHPEVMTRMVVQGTEQKSLETAKVSFLLPPLPPRRLLLHHLPLPLHLRC